MNENLQTTLQSMSVSRARTFRRCPRLEQFEYELGYKPCAKDGPKPFGSAWHCIQEIWWAAPLELRWPMVSGWFAKPQDNKGRPIDLDPFVKAHLSALARGYHARWIGEAVETVGVERKFSLPLINPATGAASKTFVLNGRLDILAKWRGKLWAYEHKSTSDDIGPGTPYWARLRLDSQSSTYIEASQLTGFDVEGVIYDVVRKTGLKPLKATPSESRKYTKEGLLYAKQRERDETPDEYEARILADIAENPNRYFARCDVPKLEGELEEARADLWQTAVALREAQRSGRFPRNPDACFQYHVACDFFGVCTHSESLEDPSLFSKRA
jgi:hypothetical protein